MDRKTKQEYYQALLERDSKYDGVFFVGVKTTGVFCHASCSARKPKFQNCEFYYGAKEALLAGYRPCKRCNPLCPPNQQSSTIALLVKQVETSPEKRWCNQDIRQLGFDESTVRRQFKKRFGMTFIEYARARRMGIAMESIRTKRNVLEAQVDVGYDSSSGFRDAFSQIMGDIPSQLENDVVFATWIDTMLGPMISIADENYLYLLEFIERRGLENEIAKLRKRQKLAVIPGKTQITQQIEIELHNYFCGNSFQFNTPYKVFGSDFEKKVWDELCKIPLGKTCSYSDIAKKIGKPKAYRAVANANGKNQLAIIIPCHRVINENGKLGGYGGGITKKHWLLEHEKK